MKGKKSYILSAFHVNPCVMVSGIYAIKNINTGKVYVGSTKLIRGRWNFHRSELRRNKHSNGYLQASWNKYGENSFLFVILEVVDNLSELLEREQYFIDTLKAVDRDLGFNICPTAGSHSGHKLSEETKLKLSKAKKGMKYRPWDEGARKRISLARKGVPKSKAHAAKIAAALKGRCPSQNTIEASVAYWTGRKHSPEHRAKQSAATKGRPRRDLDAHLERMAKRRMFDSDMEARIVEDRKSGMLLREISAKYGCSVMPIKAALRRNKPMLDAVDAE